MLNKEYFAKSGHCAKIKLFIVKILRKLFIKIKQKDVILFESLPLYSDNTKYVYDEIIKRESFKDYKFFWLLSEYMKINREDIPKGIQVLGTTADDSVLKRFFNRIKRTYYEAVAKVIIVCNEYPNLKNPRAYCIDLSHGTAMKDCSNHYNMPNYIDVSMCISSYLLKYDAHNNNCSEDKLMPLGFARNDDLFGEKNDLNKVFNKKFSKSIYWMPTYRQHKLGDSYSSISFPIIYNEEIAQEINACAKANDVLIICKPHPVQDLSSIAQVKLSNLLFIDNEFFLKNNITNYELLRSVDSLITDYSSVYYDYLLCDKPIGLCWDDFEEYNQNEGFVIDTDVIFAGGEKIYNAKEFCDFLIRIANGQDNLKTERAKITELCHDHRDNQSTNRIVDFIEEKL